MIDYCKCGCGNKVTIEGNLYIWGHNHKGKTYEEIYNNPNEQKERRRIAVKGKKRNDVLGEKNPSKRPEVRKKIIEGVKRSWKNNNKTRSSKESIIKTRETKEKNGSCIKEKDLPLFVLYTRKVRNHTAKSIKEKYIKEELKTIGRHKNFNCIDHIFSIQKGFKNGVLPSVIGSKSNIRLISFSENSKKHTRCDISIDDLFKKYDLEISGVKL